MREIKFRGFNGEKWLYGKMNSDCEIIGNVYDNPELLEAHV